MREGDRPRLKELIEDGADLSAVMDGESRNLVHVAILAGTPGLAPFLVDSGVRVHGPQGYDALGEAAFRGDMETVRLLLSHGAQLAPYSNRMSPLLYAVEGNQIELVRYFLENGASVSLREGKAASPLLRGVRQEVRDHQAPYRTRSGRQRD